VFYDIFKNDMGQMFFPGEKIIKSITGLNKKDEEGDIYDLIIGYAIIALMLGCIIGCFFSFVNSAKIFVGGFSLLAITLSIKNWIKGQEKFLTIIYGGIGLGYFYYLVSCLLGLFSNFWINLKSAGIGTLIYIGFFFIIRLFDNTKG